MKLDQRGWKQLWHRYAITTCHHKQRGKLAGIFLVAESPEQTMVGCERNVKIVREYMKALEEGEAGDSLRRFFTLDVRQIEMPNQLNPRGQESDLEHMLQRSLQGKHLLRRQSYEIVSEMAQEDRVALEARWKGVLAVAVGELTAGTEMSASFAMFFQLRDGLIMLQKNYDCFEPW